MRDISFYVKDILECIERIQEYVGNRSYEEFTQDVKVTDAVIRRLEIIGEASKYIPKDIRAKHSEIPWRKIIGMRNRITHAYFSVDYRITWRIIKEELPELKPQIQRILKEIQEVKK